MPRRKATGGEVNLSRSPRKRDANEAMFEGLVAAVATPSLHPALKLLLINGRDLTWEGPEGARFLVRSHESANFNEWLRFSKGKATLSAMAMLRSCFREALQVYGGFWKETVRTAGSATQEEVPGVIESVLDKFSKRQEALTNEGIRLLFEDFQDLADGVMARLAESILEFQSRTHAQSGHSPEDHSRMLGALLKVGGLCEQVFSIHLPKGSMRASMAVGRVPSPAGEAASDSASLELFRLTPDFAAVKGAEDLALGCFISAYFNMRLFYLDPHVAHASARYAEHPNNEFDVVIPRLSVAMEVKVYQSPATVTRHHLESKLEELLKQLNVYLEAGFKEVLLVTNLTTSVGAILQKLVEERISKPNRQRFSVVAGGLSPLLEKLEDLEKRLQAEIHKSDIAVHFSGSAHKASSPLPELPAKTSAPVKEAENQGPANGQGSPKEGSSERRKAGKKATKSK